MTWIKPDWPIPENINAASTLRLGGVSRHPFDSFNLALHVNDAVEDVMQNRQHLVDMLGLPSDPIWMEQIHSNNVIKAEIGRGIQQADACYTDEAGKVCSIMTADCLPVLLADINGDKVAAIHAGWRGLASGIISNTSHKMQSNDIIAWLGPAIGPHCFEVGNEVRQVFIDKSVKYASAFEQTEQYKYLADIYQLATIELNSLGINQIYGGDFCTMTEKERFYSYRRDGETGRMATLIWRD
ncbi:MAG: peptidoglycan editing factor PgeF [Methylococcales bacterium]|nr:peptidoglycan editing factor PgeF [Methylococcales bacterium]